MIPLYDDLSIAPLPFLVVYLAAHLQKFLANRLQLGVQGVVLLPSSPRIMRDHHCALLTPILTRRSKRQQTIKLLAVCEQTSVLFNVQSLELA